MSLTQKTKRYKNYFFCIDLDPSHELYAALEKHESFSKMPNGEFAMYTSNSYGFFSEAADDLRELLNVVLNKLAKATGTSVKIIWEQNDDRGSPTLHTRMQWLDNELARYYAVVDAPAASSEEDEEEGEEGEDDDGDEPPFTLPSNWFIRARMMFKDEGVIVLDAPKTKN